MSDMYQHPITADPSEDDQQWRERVERDFPFICPDPAQRNRYPSGYWQACWEHWHAEEQSA